MSFQFRGMPPRLWINMKKAELNSGISFSSNMNYSRNIGITGGSSMFLHFLVPPLLTIFMVADPTSISTAI